jgi:hypothetical protein
MTNILNCTPHAIVFRNDMGEDTTFPPCGSVIRLDSETAPMGEVAGLPVQSTTHKGVVGIPEDAPEGTVLIVSSMVLAGVQGGKFRFIAPATGPLDDCIRNEKGHVVAVTKFNV